VSDTKLRRFTETPYNFDPMNVIGIGVDLVECARIQRSIERFGDRFLHRVFTDGEIEYSMSMKFPERHLAARFAGKEAVAKAFGTGIGKAMGWRNIDIQKKDTGEPFLVFSGPAEIFAAKRGVTSALITLSHTEHHAIACVVLEG
jgi:holo-[acyl-carrier protein] synthase